VGFGDYGCTNARHQRIRCIEGGTETGTGDPRHPHHRLWNGKHGGGSHEVRGDGFHHETLFPGRPGDRRKKIFVTPSAGEQEKRETNYLPYQIVTSNPQMLKLLQLARRVAKSKATVLIQGESGTGKELIARYVCAHSDRCDQPFIAINCAAIPSNLLESEMFGYEKGAFTGATQRRIGKFELANMGTLFLDEISEMDVQLQAKLLRAIQESEIDRLGGRTPVPIDVRIIATTNISLRKAIEEKRFREDLYYRLNVITVTIPPLRDRRDDVPVLAAHFLEKHGRLNNQDPPQLAPETIQKLKDYRWPGNVRQLENVIEGALVLCEGQILLPEHVLLEDDEGNVTASEAAGCLTFPADRVISIPELEKAAIFHALTFTKGNKERAAQLLGISIRTLRNKLREYRQGDEQAQPLHSSA